jgi:hypothetical protein
MRKDLEGKSNELIEVLSWHLCGGIDESHKTSLRIFGVSIEI